ncbi:MAG TPA: SDR family NAD(P)-dependent oxidoreductase [Trebonia sp.]|nr:SDR family NAD(P)-dependent oxidoreductase [Trebonia sp.]
MNKYFAGRTAVITGAGSGIGTALPLRLAADGARLALLDLNGPAVAATTRQCEEAGARAALGGVCWLDARRRVGRASGVRPAARAIGTRAPGRRVR